MLGEPLVKLDVAILNDVRPLCQLSRHARLCRRRCTAYRDDAKRQQLFLYIGLLKDGKPVWTTANTNLLTGILPGEQPRRWTQTLDLRGVQPGTYTLALRVPNPLPTGKPLRFANATQDADAPGWLTLAPVTVTP